MPVPLPGTPPERLVRDFAQPGDRPPFPRQPRHPCRDPRAHLREGEAGRPRREAGDAGEHPRDPGGDRRSGGGARLRPHPGRELGHRPLHPQRPFRQRRAGPALAQGRHAPYNGRKLRHHQRCRRRCSTPQAVTPEMGPTAAVPYSHYWTFDHEENHDNFAGADHLDFGYQLSGMEGEPASGPGLEVRSRRHPPGPHRPRPAPARGGDRPPAGPGAVLRGAPLAAGSVLLYSHNTFHRGNHRRGRLADLAGPPPLHVALLALPDHRRARPAVTTVPSRSTGGTPPPTR